MKIAILFIMILALASIVTAAPMFMQVEGNIVDTTGKPSSAFITIELSGRVFFNQTEIGNYGVDEPIYITTSDEDASIIFSVNGAKIKEIPFQDDVIADIEIVVENKIARTTDESDETTKRNVEPATIVLLLVISFIVYKMFFEKKSNNSII